MAFQFSVGSRNAALDAIESAVGTDPVLKIFSGSAPADCAAADSGTVLVSMTLPNDWMAAASGGSKALSGTWEDTSANATGTAGHFRVYDSGETTCHIQGSVSGSGGGGDMELDNVSIVSTQQVTITAFTLTAGGA